MRVDNCLRIVALIVLWMLLDSSGRAFACSCALPAGPPCRVRPGDVAFVGTVTAVLDAEGEGRSGRRFQFRVQEAFSGVNGPSVEVFSDTSSCGVNFVPGESYLVDGQKDGQGNVSVTACSFTQPAYEAPEEIAILRRIGARQSVLGVFGQLIEFRRPGPQSLPTDADLRQPLHHVPVEVFGAAATRLTTTDAFGRFAVWDLPPGVYRLRVDLKPPLELWKYSRGFHQLDADPDRIELLDCPARVSLTASSWK